MIIYIDVLIIVNLIIGYFLLLSTALISGYTYKRKKILFSAIFSALSCLIIFLEIDYQALNFLIRILIFIISVYIAFGYKNKRQFLAQTAYYLLFNMLLTGMVIYFSSKTDTIYQKNLVYYFDISPIVLVFSAIAIYFVITLCQLVKEQVSSQNTYEIEIAFKNHTQNLKLNAFHDTGFAIKDVLNNKDVILIDFVQTKHLLKTDATAAINDFFNENYNVGNDIITPVFFNTISGEGAIPAIKTEYIIINNKKIENVIAAFSKNTLSQNVQAIFGNDIKKQL